MRRPRIWGALGLLLLAVWTSGEVAGLLVHGSWPHVAIPWAVVEVLRVAVRREPDAGIPLGLFWLCLVLEVVGGGLILLAVRRHLGGDHQHVWVPRTPDGIARPEPFLRSYRRLVRDDARRTAQLRRASLAPKCAPSGDPALSVLCGGLGEQPQETAGDVDVVARDLARRFTRDQLRALVGELAERRLTREDDLR